MLSAIQATGEASVSNQQPVQSASEQSNSTWSKVAKFATRAILAAGVVVALGGYIYFVGQKILMAVSPDRAILIIDSMVMAMAMLGTYAMVVAVNGVVEEVFHILTAEDLCDSPSVIGRLWGNLTHSS
ncbi:MAG: hypothetical protein KR126chlam1_00259 [Chlamydiae bacterium]|nr:hypothetical protein [Chlamydiota bacterium]